MEIACREESEEERVCASRRRERKVGGKKTLEPSFPILQLRTKLGLTESRHATRCVCTYTHTRTHTRTHVCTRPRVHTGRAYSIPYLISLPGIYIFPRWPSADVPFNAAKMPEEKFLVASRQRFSPNIFAAACLFSSIPYGNIPSEYRAGRSSTIIIIAVSPFNRVTPIFTSVV